MSVPLGTGQGEIQEEGRGHGRRGDVGGSGEASERGIRQWD